MRVVSTCVFNPHLQCGLHYLLHGGEVGLPEELSLLAEGEDLILVDGAHRGWDLQQKDSSQSALLWDLNCGDRKIKTGPKDALRKSPSTDKAH